MNDILGGNEEPVVRIQFFPLIFWALGQRAIHQMIFFEKIGIAVLTKIEDKSNLMMELHYVYF